MKMLEISIKFALKFDTMDPINSSIGSDNGAAPSRAEAIIWPTDGWFPDAHMRQPASVS